MGESMEKFFFIISVSKNDVYVAKATNKLRAIVGNVVKSVMDGRFKTLLEADNKLGVRSPEGLFTDGWGEYRDLENGTAIIVFGISSNEGIYASKDAEAIVMYDKRLWILLDYRLTISIFDIDYLYMRSLPEKDHLTIKELEEYVVDSVLRHIYYSIVASSYHLDLIYQLTNLKPDIYGLLLARYTDHLHDISKRTSNFVGFSLLKYSSDLEELKTLTPIILGKIVEKFRRKPFGGIAGGWEFIGVGK